MVSANYVREVDETRPFHPRGAALEVIRDRSPELLACGPSGTGKTRAGLEKVHMCMEKYPRSRALLVRKTRRSLTQSTMVTFEDHVLPAGHPCLSKGSRDHRSSYVYPNGSEVVCAGLDDPGKALSSEYDIILVDEAVQLLPFDWQILSTRNRNWRMPYNQMIGLTNPDSPYHWLKRRCDAGITKLYTSVHEDNPELWDAKRGEWTPKGADYLAKLGNLTGATRDRYLRGLWVQAEGAFFTMLDEKTHLFKASQKWTYGHSPEWKKILCVDFGFAAPFCALWVLFDDRGDPHVYREHYEAGLTVPEQVEVIRRKTGGAERIDAIYMDPSMWAHQQGHFGTAKPDVSIADLFIAMATSDDRFGGVIRGSNKRDHNLQYLRQVLSRDNALPNLYIEESCENTWSELVQAVHAIKPNTENVLKEDLAETCADHAITALYYGLATKRMHEVQSMPVEVMTREEALAFSEREQERARRERMRTIPDTIYDEYGGLNGFGIANAY